MINGDLNAFLDKLFLLEELEVEFRGRQYLIQGWSWRREDPIDGTHIEMFRIDDDGSSDYAFKMDGKSNSECANAFLEAQIWDGMTFREAEAEIEWLA